MTPPFVVRAEGPASRFVDQRPVLASLPARFRLSETLPIDVLLASCRDAPLASLARHPQARGLVLTDIGAAAAAELIAIREALGDRPVVVLSLSERSLTSPQTQRLFPDASEEFLIVDGQTAQVGDDLVALRQGALELITLLEGLTGSGWAYEALSRAANRLVLSGRRRGAAIARLHCALGARTVSLSTVSQASRRTVRLNPSPHARPAEASVHDAGGALTLALVFEGGVRRDWAALHAALCDGSPLSLDAWIDRVARLDASLA